MNGGYISSSKYISVRYCMKKKSMQIFYIRKSTLKKVVIDVEYYKGRVVRDSASQIPFVVNRQPDMNRQKKIHRPDPNKIK